MFINAKLNSFLIKIAAKETRYLNPNNNNKAKTIN